MQFDVIIFENTQKYFIGVNYEFEKGIKSYCMHHLGIYAFNDAFHGMRQAEDHNHGMAA